MIFSPTAELLLLAILLVLSGFFASSETAIISVSRARVKRLADLKVRNAKKLLEIKLNPQKILITILIANNLVNVTAASVAAAIALQFFQGDWGLAISAAVTTFLILIFGEITPKSVALKHNDRIALFAVPILSFLSVIFSPVIFVLGHITGFFANLLGGAGDEQRFTEEEVKAVVSMSAEEGSILREEKDMIHRIFLLNDIRAGDVMTPRSGVTAVRSGTLVADIDFNLLREHSRVPVYRKNLDDIVGVFYAGDYFAGGLESEGKLPVDKFMRKPLFVHAEKKVNKILADFQKAGTQLAIVVDDKGDTIGLVTVLDIVEEIIGEIGERK